MTSSFESTAADLLGAVFIPDEAGRFEFDAQDSPPMRPEAQAEEAEERLRAEAFETGREEGLATARTRCEPVLRALSAAAAELSEQRHDYLEAQRHLLVELAVEIAESIVGRTLAANPESIVERIATALRSTDTSADVTVELNPADFELAREASEASTLPERLQLAANPELAVGDFLVTSGSTTIDARLAVLLDGVRQTLTDLETLNESTSTRDGGEEA